MTMLVRRGRAATNFDGYSERLTTSVIGRRRRRRSPGRRGDVSDFFFVFSTQLVPLVGRCKLSTQCRRVVMSSTVTAAVHRPLTRQFTMSSIS